MARLEITLSDKIIFEMTLTVRVTDLNYGGHLSNVAVLGLMHEARVQMFLSWGCSEADLFGPSLLQVDTAIQYLSESFLGDQLRIQIGCGDTTRASFELLYRLSNEQGGGEVARGRTGLVCYDRQRKKVVSLPQELVTRLTQHTA